jgi:hypothetical protein
MTPYVRAAATYFISRLSGGIGGSVLHMLSSTVSISVTPDPVSKTLLASVSDVGVNYFRTFDATMPTVVR